MEGDPWDNMANGGGLVQRDSTGAVRRPGSGGDFGNQFGI